MSAPLKAAVIGVGSMGRNHARVYTELGETTLVAVSDAHLATAQTVAAKYGVNAYADYQEMLAREKPDIVTIAVPTRLHREVAGIAMEAGAHVLVEKPIAATVEEGQALIACARACNRRLTVGHIVRFNPAIQALKEHLDAGELGQLFQIVCRRVGPFPSRIQDVGVVVDLAPHDLDVMRFLSGAEPIRVYAETQQKIHTDHEDLLTALLRFDNGLTGMLEINWLTPLKVREITVLGELGMFLVNDLTQDLYFYENAEATGDGWNQLNVLKGVSEGKMIRFPLRRYEPLRAELEAFAKAVLNDAPTAVCGEDGLAALQLALALIESNAKHTAIEIENGAHCITA
ncbi:MAG TPA: Gfo/Idh/MocA family oxidoreductase [Anaerolineae bacterium]|nr:Gfo/Idh/MocA family oxidoreductase [Anaerolineae bacterium]